MLERYNNAVPDGAQRIMVMAERQGAHRMVLERKVVEADATRAREGLYAGVIVALAFLGVAAFLINGGHDVAGGILGTVDIASLVGVFVYGTIQRREERKDRAQIMTGGTPPGGPSRPR